MTTGMQPRIASATHGVVIIALLLLFTLRGVRTYARDASPQGAHQSVGLVLSGGGAKGIAHAGVIQALEENDIPVDYITGTSMGAIMGALYATGHTPAEMMELLRSKDFGYWSTGKINPSLTYFFASEPQSPALFTLPIKTGKSSATEAPAPPASLINPIPMSLAFVELFEAYSAQCSRDFDKLMVPFRCVASNLTANRGEVFRGGSLADAVRASMSFPLVFQPIEIDGTLLYDGGIYNNFPTGVMREDFSPSVMIGVDVSAPDDSIPSSVLSQVSYLVTRPQSYDIPEDEGIRIRVDVSGLGLLDFDKADEIYRRGYDKAMEMMDSIKSRIHTRMPVRARNLRREVFRAKTPGVAYSRVDVSGGTPSQNLYLASLFRPAAHTDTLGESRVRRAYYSAVSTGQIQDFRVRSAYDDTTGLFALNLKATVKAPLRASLGGYLTSSANSYLYLSLGYSTLSFRSLSTSVAAWIGQSYMAGVFRARYNLNGGDRRLPSAFGVEAVASRRSYSVNDKLFFLNEPTFSVNHEYFGKIYWGSPAGRRGTVEAGAGGGRIYNSFYQSTDAESFAAGRDHVALDLAKVYAVYDAYTLDDANFPTSGYHCRLSAAGFAGRSKFTNSLLQGHSANEASRRQTWAQFYGKYRLFVGLHRHWALGLRAEALLSTRKLLPDYYAALSTAPAYTPTPASDNAFNTALRANSYIALGITPVYKLNDNFSLRATAHLFAPLRRILDSGDGLHTARYGKFFGHYTPFVEIDATYRLPFASVGAYANYTATEGAKINVGISFGIYIPAPKFLE